MRRDGGSSELWINVVGYGNVTSSLVKLVAMGTQFGGSLNISVSRRLLFLLVAAALRLLVATLGASAEVVDVTKLGIAAREEVLACVVHFLGKGELLAVENQSSFVLLQLFLGPGALILAPKSICLGLGKCLVIVFNLVINV